MRSAVFITCMLPAVPSWSLTVGQARGAALIGRPLDLAVPLVLDPGTDTGSLCVEPEIFYGDSRAPGRASAQLDVVSPTQGTVRIRMESLVDEPVVTVYLRIGCEQKLTRRFVLFAERPGDALSPAPLAAQPVAPVPTVRAVPAVPAAATQTPAPPERPAAAGPGARTPAARPPAARATPKPKAEPRSARPEKPPARARARLQLEPLDLSIDRDPQLKSTQAIDLVPEASAQRRAEAAALWQALNAQPEDVLRNNQRLQSLEGDIKLLRDAVTKNTALLAEVQGDLVKAREERFANPLVYGLALALLGVLALAALLWNRARSAGPASGRDWWRGPAAAGTTGYGDEPSPGPATDAAAPITTPSPVVQPPVPAVAQRTAEPDLAVSPAMLDAVRTKAIAARGTPSRPPFRESGRGEFADFQNSLSSGPRSVKAEELHDIQQQADFFVSLGEYERAIEVLRSHIYVNPGTSALAWLDLLGIFHQLERRKDYEWVRGEFNRVFNAQAPAFDGYGADDEGLEGYEQALSRIAALWPSPKVLEVIEESIFRKPGHEGGEAFSLEAYRELLLLHGIGKEVIEAGDAPVDFVSSSQPTGFSSTSLEALSARLLEPAGALSNFGLDINLDEAPPPSSEFVHIGAPPVNPTVDDRTVDEGMVDFDLPDIDYQLPKKRN